MFSEALKTTPKAGCTVIRTKDWQGQWEVPSAHNPALAMHLTCPHLPPHTLKYVGFISMPWSGLKGNSKATRRQMW